MSMEVSAPAAPVRARRARQDMPVPAERAPEPDVPTAVEVEADATVGPVSPEKVRKPMGGRRSKLDNSERPGFHRHWFNDKGSRIKDALEAGYAHVKAPDGSPMKYIVGVSEHGGGITAYRMEIPLEWYEADQKAKLDERIKVMEQIKRGQAAGVQIGQDGAYQPVNKAGTVGVDIRNK